MRWAPINKQLAVPDQPELLLQLDETTVPTVSIISVITDLDVYLQFAVDLPTVMDASNSLHLKAGESYGESAIMISGSIFFVNADAGEQPSVRGIVWGR